MISIHLDVFPIGLITRFISLQSLSILAHYVKALVLVKLIIQLDFVIIQ